jgi:hypothetical protein
MTKPDKPLPVAGETDEPDWLARLLNGRSPRWTAWKRAGRTAANRGRPRPA